MANPIIRPVNGRLDTQSELDQNNLPVQESTQPQITRAAKPKQQAPESFMIGTKQVDTEGFDFDPAEIDRPIYADKPIEAQLEKSQSGFNMWMNAAARGASEIVLGTASGISMFVDVENTGIGLEDAEKDYGNWFSDLMDDAQESIKEATPIYRTEEAQAGWAPFDSTWWANNAESIATTASIFIPVGGVMRLAGMAGKATRGLLAGSRIARATEASSVAARAAKSALYGKKFETVANTVGSAVVSRYLESTMEASESFKGIYDELISQGVPEEEAKTKAGKAASKVWGTNWLNLAQDIFQYRGLSKGMNVATAASKEFRKNLFTKGSDYVKTMLSEAGEELGQYVIGEEASREALSKGGKSFFELNGLTERLSEYVKTPEAKTSMMMGAAGGGIFQALMNSPKLYGKLTGSYDAREAYLAKITALDQMDVNTSYLVDGATLLDQTLSYARDGKLNNLRSFYSDLADMSDQELEAQGLSSEEIADKRKKDSEILSDIDFIGNEYSRIWNDTTTSDIIKIEELATVYQKSKLAQAKAQILESSAELDAKVSGDKVNEISSQKLAIKHKQNKLIAYEMAKRQYDAETKGTDRGSKKVTEHINKKIESLKEEIKSDTEALETSGEDSEISITSRDNDILNLDFQEVGNDVRDIQVQERIGQTTTPEGREIIEEQWEQAKANETLKKISPNMSVSDLKEMMNAEMRPAGWKQAKAKLTEITNKAEVDLPPAIAGSESFEADLAKRYSNTPLFMREMSEVKGKLASSEDIAAVNAVNSAEEFSNLYANNKNVAAAFDSLMSEKKSKYVKADLKGQIDPETTFVEPENPTDNTPTENPEGPVVYTPEGYPSIPDEAMIFSNAVVLYTYNAKANGFFRL